MQTPETAAWSQRVRGPHERVGPAEHLLIWARMLAAVLLGGSCAGSHGSESLSAVAVPRPEEGISQRSSASPALASFLPPTT